MKDCWILLGIKPGSSADEIRRAFAKAATLHHPEDDPAFFALLQSAYREALKKAGGNAPRHPGQAAAFVTPSNVRCLEPHAAQEGEGDQRQKDLPSPQSCDNADFFCLAGGQPLPDHVPDTPALHFLRVDGGGEMQAGHHEDGTKPPCGQAVLRFDVHSPEEKPAQEDAAETPVREQSGVLIFPAAADEPSAGNALPESPMLSFAAVHEAAGAARPGAMPQIPLGGDAVSFAFLLAAGAEDAGNDEAGEPAESLARETDDVLAALLCRMESMAARPCSLESWLELTGCGDFLHFMPDHRFLAGLEKLCLRHMTDELCAALYAAYGLTSLRAPLRRLPQARALILFLERYSGLPSVDLPCEDQAAMLNRCNLVLNRIRTLCLWPQSEFMWQQYFLTEEFRMVGFQPCFMERCRLLIAGNAMLNLELLYAYDVIAADSPYRIKTAKSFLPTRWSFRNEGLKEYARFLLNNDQASFYDAASAELVDLFMRTARHFPFSGSSSHWQYVFDRPQFGMLRFEDRFANMLADFAGQGDLPPAFYDCLRNAYADEPQRTYSLAVRHLLAIAARRRNPEPQKGFWTRLSGKQQ